MEQEYYCLADIWGNYLRKVTLPLKYGPLPPVRGTDQCEVRRGKFLTSPNACLTQTNEKSGWAKASHCLQGQGGPTSTPPKRSPHEQRFRYPLGPPSRYAQGQQRLRAQGFSEASTCQAQITLTTNISGVPQQQVPNSIQSGNLFQGSSLVGQLLFAFLNKFSSRSCGASTG